MSESNYGLDFNPSDLSEFSEDKEREGYTDDEIKRIFIRAFGPGGAAAVEAQKPPDLGIAGFNFGTMVESHFKKAFVDRARILSESSRFVDEITKEANRIHAILFANGKIKQPFILSAEELKPRLQNALYQYERLTG